MTKRKAESDLKEKHAQLSAEQIRALYSYVTAADNKERKDTELRDEVATIYGLELDKKTIYNYKRHSFEHVQGLIRKAEERGTKTAFKEAKTKSVKLTAAAMEEVGAFTLDPKNASMSLEKIAVKFAPKYGLLSTMLLHEFRPGGQDALQSKIEMETERDAQMLEREKHGYETLICPLCLEQFICCYNERKGGGLYLDVWEPSVHRLRGIDGLQTGCKAAAVFYTSKFKVPGGSEASDWLLDDTFPSVNVEVWRKMFGAGEGAVYIAMKFERPTGRWRVIYTGKVGDDLYKRWSDHCKRGTGGCNEGELPDIVVTLGDYLSALGIHNLEACLLTSTNFHVVPSKRWLFSANEKYGHVHQFKTIDGEEVHPKILLRLAMGVLNYRLMKLASTGVYTLASRPFASFLESIDWPERISILKKVMGLLGH